MSATSTDAHTLAGELMSRTRWTSERLAAHQREQLNGLVRHAVTHSPYYRAVLGPASGAVSLRELPTLTKTTLMEHFDEIVTDERLRRGAVEAHLDGSRAGELVAGHRVFATSGSTGRRGMFVYSQAEFTVWVAAQLRMMLTMGVTPAMRVAAIGAPSPVHLSRQMFAALTAGQPSAAPALSVTTPIADLVAALNAYQPDAVPTYASTAALLAQEQLAGRLRITPSMVGAGAEVLTDDMHRRIRDAWDLEPHQAYLSTEVPLLASTSSAQAGMHLWEDLTLVEVVDEHDQPVAPGVPGHKVLVTNLVNHTQPLIRYELSDSVTLATDPDPTGWPFRRLAAVDGRSDDIITLPASDGGVVGVHPLRLRAPFLPFREVTQYQITHDHHNGLTVRVVLAPDATRDLADRVRAELARALHDAGALPPPITVVPVHEIPRERGHAAKLKLIRSTVRPG